MNSLSHCIVSLHIIQIQSGAHFRWDDDTLHTFYQKSGRDHRCPHSRSRPGSALTAVTTSRGDGGIRDCMPIPQKPLALDHGCFSISMCAGKNRGWVVVAMTLRQRRGACGDDCTFTFVATSRHFGFSRTQSSMLRHDDTCLIIGDWHLWVFDELVVVGKSFEEISPPYLLPRDVYFATAGCHHTTLCRGLKEAKGKLCTASRNFKSGTNEIDLC